MKIEEELRRERDRAQKYSDLAGVIMVALDKDGRVTLLNRKGCEVLGCTLDEALGKNWFENFLPARVRDRVKAVFQSLMEGKIEPVEYYENPVLTINGEERLIAWHNTLITDSKGKIVGILSSGNDITEQKRSEEEQATLTSILESFVSSYHLKEILEKSVKVIKDHTGCSSVGIRILDEEGNIPYEAYTGFPTEFYKSESPLNIKTDKCMCIYAVKGEYDPSKPFFTSDGSFYSNGTSKLLASVSQEEKGETRNVCNLFGYESVSLTPIRLGDQVLGVIHIADQKENMVPLEKVQFIEKIASRIALAIERVRIATQLKETQDKLKKYTEHLERLVEERTRELREAERLAAIGETAAMVGHDLRNPLQAITNAVYYLRNKAPQLDGKSEEMLEVIERGIEYCNDLVTSLLDYSREIRLELTETTPKSIVETALSLVQVPENIQVSTSTLDSPRVRVDVKKMQRVLINIIKNAVDAMPEGGKLTIQTRRLGDNVEFAFSDTGVGISESALEKIWTPLYTTKSKGIGLGLPICKRIVEAHGGVVSAESRIGEGSTFKVTVPINPKEVKIADGEE